MSNSSAEDIALTETTSSQPHKRYNALALWWMRRRYPQLFAVLRISPSPPKKVESRDATFFIHCESYGISSPREARCISLPHWCGAYHHAYACIKIFPNDDIQRQTIDDMQFLCIATKLIIYKAIALIFISIRSYSFLMPQVTVTTKTS